MKVANGILSLETARLLLRPFADRRSRRLHAAHLCRRRGDALFAQTRSRRPANAPNEPSLFFNDHWSQYGYGVWAVTDKIAGQFIGHCGLNFVPEAGEVEVLYALRKDRWGQGIATEAARASVHFGFETANLARLIALAVPENIASRRVMEHLGFAYEKDAHYFGLDLVYYVLPREQFHLDDSLFRMR